jgi:adenylylsulfate kinase
LIDIDWVKEDSMEKGTVYFFTGLSGAGKTTIGGLFHRRLKSTKSNVVLLDGDQTRPVFNEDVGYTDEDRRRGAYRLFRVVKMLSDQGLDVVVCGICMYQDVRDWARANIPHYKEIYIKVSWETLYRRDQKGLYSKGENVVGVDMPFDKPQNPDFVVENDGHETPYAIVRRLERELGMEREDLHVYVPEGINAQGRAVAGQTRR